MEPSQGLVVQPGLKFAPAGVHTFDMGQPGHLIPVLRNNPRLCFKTRSTDHQGAAVRADLARHNFGILKAGPARSSLGAKRYMHCRISINGCTTGDHIAARTEALMTAKPRYWRGHYNGGNTRLLRHFGYAGCIRCYRPKVEAEGTGHLRPSLC